MKQRHMQVSTMLADYIGRQIRLEGKYNGKDDKYSNRYTVVLANVRVFDLNGSELEWNKDHTWLQEAWNVKDIKELKLGDRLLCIATARQYETKHGRVDVCFADPIEIEWQAFV